MTILHPPPKNGTLYLQPNNTRLLLRVQSRYITMASRRGSDYSVTFQTECPPEFLSILTLVQPPQSSVSEITVSEPSLYAVLDLSLGSEEQRGPVQVELEARNNVTEESLMVVVQIEEPLGGLMVQPDPTNRVLMESVVVSLCLNNIICTNKWYFKVYKLLHCSCVLELQCICASRFQSYI